MAITLTKITPIQHASAVAWITDAFRLAEGDLDDLTAQQIHKIIQQRYSDGWSGFLFDLGADTWI